MSLIAVTRSEHTFLELEECGAYSRSKPSASKTTLLHHKHTPTHARMPSAGQGGLVSLQPIMKGFGSDILRQRCDHNFQQLAWANPADSLCGLGKVDLAEPWFLLSH